MNRAPPCAARGPRRRLTPLLLTLVIGCAPTYDSGCDSSPPQATDASYPAFHLVSTRAPCSVGLEGVRGSEPHLYVNFQCPGVSESFLVAVKVDGVLQAMHEVEGAGYGTQVWIDAGSWEPADPDWHQVEVILDPLNLFPESDESNNRAQAQMRIVAPDAVLDGANSGFSVPWEFGGDGTLVSQVYEGIPVDVRLRLQYGGPYEGIVRSVGSGAVLAASDTATMASCPSYFGTTNFVTRWTPPGPGSYVVEFRIQPLGSVPDNPANNVVTKTLTVLPTGARASGTRFGESAR